MRFKEKVNRGVCTLVTLSVSASLVPAVALAEAEETETPVEIGESVEKDETTETGKGNLEEGSADTEAEDETKEEAAEDAEKDTEDTAAVEEDSEAEDEEVVEEDSEAEDEEAVKEDSEAEDDEVVEEDSEAEDEEAVKEDSEAEDGEAVEEDSEAKDGEAVEEDSKVEDDEAAENDSKVEEDKSAEGAEDVGIESLEEEAPLMTMSLEETESTAIEQDGLAFNGKSDYAMTASSIKMPDTAEVWVKFDKTARQIIMNNYKNGKEASWGIEMDNSGALRYWESDGSGYNRCIFTADKTVEGNAVLLETDEWMLISIVRDHENNKILAYINGEYAGSVSTTKDLYCNETETTYSLYFGTDPRMGNWFEGEIGEVRLWSDVRTADEIKEYYAKSASGDEAGLAHCWDFGDTDGTAYSDTVVKDKAGNNDITTKGYAEKPEAEERQGLYFDGSKNDGNYALTEEPIEIPDTVEVWVKLDEGQNRRQIIMNNYLNENTKSWGLEVNDDNTLRYWENVNGGKKDRISYKFTDVPICTGEWMLISVVRNSTMLDVYINGEYKTSGSMLTDEWSFTDTELSTSTYFGTDLRKQYWLAGKIGEVRMFSDVRTAEEIKAYYDGTDLNTEDLEHCWDFGDINGKAYDSTVVKDTAGNNDIITEGFAANTAEYTGLVFDYEEEEYVQVQGAVTTPTTVEIRIKLDSEGSHQRQTIMNNYGNGGKTWGVEVTKDNQLRLWEDTGVKNDIKFTDLGDICDDTWKLISLVRDAENKKVLVYIDGEYATAVSVSGFANATLENWLCFGSDYHTDPTYYLNGEINEVRMWSDVRTADEIKEYSTKTVKGNEDGLAHAWSFASANGEEGSKKVYSDTVFADKVKTGGFAVKAVGYPDDPNTEYTVKFSIAGATVTAGDAAALVERTQKVNTLVTDPNVTLERGGSTFKGWFKDAACTKEWNFETDKVTADTTIYAGFQYNYASAKLGELNGVKFGLEEQLCAEQALTEAPLTFEATVKLDKNLEGRGGIICGNYADFGYYNYSIVYTSFEVAENGQPRLYWKLSNKNSKGTVQSIVIPGVDLRQDEWVHVAMTFDPEEDKVYCYVNGELASVVEDCKLTPKVPTQALKVGGDYRGTGGHGSKDLNRPDDYNGQYFKGEIANVSVWSDVRTAEEIKADFAAVKAGNVTSGKDNLQASWNFNVAEGYTAKEYKELDLTGENDLYKFKDWLNPAFAEGSYSMIALPDTQFLSQTYNQIYKDMTQWIANHKDTYNIKAVMHLGDMVNTINDTQLNNCVAATDILDENGVAWMPMQGNHDIGSSSREWDARYTYEEYSQKPWFVESYGKTADGKDSLRHTCWEVEAGGRKYLIFSLGWNPKKDALDWAENIIKENPDKNVILTAHAYMYVDGTQLNDEDMDWPTPSGNDIWDQLGKYPNVVLAIGGHIGYPDLARRTDKNGAGKDVSSILCDAQGIDNTYGLGMLMMLTFHEGSDEVDINWYSVDNDQMFRDRNQFTISVPHVGETTDEDTDKDDTDDNTGDNDNTGDDSTTGNKGSSSSKKRKYYDVNTEDAKHGEVKVSANRVKNGSTVTVTVTPDKGYELKELNVTDDDGDSIKVKDLGDGKYSFVMPKGEADIEPVFEKIETKDEDTKSDADTEEKGVIRLTIDQLAAEVFGETVINDVAPVMRKERTMLPARFVAEALGAKVTWNDTTKKATITTEDTTLEIYAGSAFAFVDGEAVLLDAAAFIENGRTYLPVRFIAEGLGAEVQWDADAQTVTIIPGK